MKRNTTILVTVHGSHLYGLNHSDSDLDLFRPERAQPSSTGRRELLSR